MQLKVSSLPGQWSAVEMEFLCPSKGWFPLWLLAPARQQGPPLQTDSMPESLSRAASQRASTLTREALCNAHQQVVEGHEQLSVHGDVRLPNIIGHIGAGYEVDRVVFVDFDWAGLQGVTRYA